MKIKVDVDVEYPSWPTITTKKYFKTADYLVQNKLLIGL